MTVQETAAHLSLCCISNKIATSFLLLTYSCVSSEISYYDFFPPQWTPVPISNTSFIIGNVYPSKKKFAPSCLNF